jgi:hypothetical protein
MNICSLYLQNYITKTANVSISGTTKVSEIAQIVSLCLRSVAKMAEDKILSVALCKDTLEIAIGDVDAYIPKQVIESTLYYLK